MCTPLGQSRCSTTRRPTADHRDAMSTVYKNTRGQHAVRQWCFDAIARAAFPPTTATVDASAGRVSLASAGGGGTRVVLVPGTGFSAAVTLPWLEALSLRWPTTVVDLPGQLSGSIARSLPRLRGHADQLLVPTEISTRSLWLDGGFEPRLWRTAAWVEPGSVTAGPAWTGHDAVRTHWAVERARNDSKARQRRSTCDTRSHG
jgi:hypothetical protein